jgi:hypothetical protein
MQLELSMTLSPTSKFGSSALRLVEKVSCHFGSLSGSAYQVFFAGIDKGRHSATLSQGKPGVLHGVRTYILQSPAGQIVETHSISAGLDYPGVGPEHAWLKDSGRGEYVVATDEEALRGFRLCTQLEGIIPGMSTPLEMALICLNMLAQKRSSRHMQSGKPFARPKCYHKIRMSYWYVMICY